MKKKEFEKMRMRSAAELKKDAVENREKLWGMQRELNDGKLKNVRSLRVLRRDIARILTLLTAEAMSQTKKN